MSGSGDYVSREAVVQFIRSYRHSTDAAFGMEKRLDKIPAADVRPIIKAHWHDVYMTGPCSWAGTCSHCGQANDIPPPRNAHYCPNCGADMREPPKEEN